MTSVTFHGGVGEIGNNKVLVESGRSSVFLDFGLGFGVQREYFSFPNKAKELDTLRKIGAIPVLDRLYSDYKLSEEEKKIEEEIGYRKVMATFKPPAGDGGVESRAESQLPKLKGIRLLVDGVFISHAHLDHYGHIDCLDYRIPVYMGENTRRICLIKDEMANNGNRIIVNKEVRPFKTGDVIRDIDSFEIRPYAVDHSIPASYGFIIEADGCRIGYTGDLRMHGPKRELTEKFIKELEKAGLDALICEGTSFATKKEFSDQLIKEEYEAVWSGLGKMTSESEVERKLGEIFTSAKGLCFIEYGLYDVDRIRSIHRAAEKSGRKLVVSYKQAFILDKLESCPRLEAPKLSAEEILILKARDPFYTWEKPTLLKYRHKLVGYDEITANQGKYVVAIRPSWEIESMVKLKPVDGSAYVLSRSEPYDEEGEIELNRLLNWLKLLNMPLHHAHCSGHMTPGGIVEMIGRVKPKKLFPIHTENPEAFKKTIETTTKETEVITPEKGRPIGI